MSECLSCKQPIAPRQGRLVCYMDDDNVLQLAGEVCERCRDACLDERDGDEDEDEDEDEG